MIKPKCDLVSCGQELTQFGALLYGPVQNGLSLKQHVCASCYEKIKFRCDGVSSTNGAFLFGPPGQEGTVKVHDISKHCYERMQREFFLRK